jgi:uncharacterized protein YggE
MALHRASQTLLVAVSLLLGAGVAQSSTAEVTVPGSGVVWAVPDQVQIDLGWSGVEDGVAGVIRAGEAAMASIQAALLAAGIAPEDIRTVSYYLWREERWEEGGATTLLGFRLTHHISVLVRDVSRFATIMDVASTAGVNQIGGISFRVSDREALEREARRKAFADAERRANELAAHAGLRILGVKRIEEGSLMEGFSMTASADGPASEGRGGGFAPGQSAIEVRLRVVFETER